METASIIASIVSTILAVFAIGLAVFFYTQSKNTETHVKTALEGIRTQTDTLQKLTGRWMDRLTKFVTSPRNLESVEQRRLIETLKDLPRDIASQLPTPSSTTAQNQLLLEIVTAYCALYYYTAISNYWAQWALPALEDFDANPLSQFIKDVVDNSYKDFNYIAATIGRIEPTLLTTSPLKHLFDKVETEYKQFIVDSTTAYARRAEQTT